MTAGAFAGRAIRHHMEYACDAFSKEIMGSGKPLASALEKMEVFGKKMKHDMFGKLSDGKRQTAERVSELLEGFMHPPVAKRVERLR